MCFSFNLIFLIKFCRMSNADSSMKESLVVDIKNVLDSVNPFAKNFRMLQRYVTSDSIPDVKLRILGKRGRDGRRYNLPTASEVAALIVGDFDTAGYDRDIVVQTQSGALQRVPLLSASYLPMQYPLFFPRGEDGYVENILYSTSSGATKIKRGNVTLREWFAYRIQHRVSQSCILLFGGRLFQQFLVDGYSMVEATRLQWIRFHQTDLRAHLYNGLAEAVLRGESNSASTGKRIIVPSSFVGGARYMFQNYQDAMAICGWAGYPDLFITFTCNYKWPELVSYFKRYGFKSQDRPDMVSRLFKIKLDQMIKDIKKGDIFGKVRAGKYHFICLTFHFIFLYIVFLFLLFASYFFQLFILLNFKKEVCRMLISWFSCLVRRGIYVLKI